MLINSNPIEHPNYFKGETADQTEGVHVTDYDRFGTFLVIYAYDAIWLLANPLFK